MTGRSDADLREIERRAWMSYFQDGLFDIVLGVLLLCGGLLTLLEERTFVSVGWRMAFYVAMIGLPVAILLAGKKYITLPRIGRVRFAPARRRKMRNATLAVVAAVLATVVLWLLMTGASSWLGSESDVGVGDAVVGLITITSFFSMAYFLDYRRLYAYGVLYAASFVTGSPVLLLTSGTIILLIGLAVLIRFLRSYPRGMEAGPSEEESDGNAR